MRSALVSSMASILMMNVSGTEESWDVVASIGSVVVSWWVDSVSSLVRPWSTLKDFVVEIPLDGDVVDLGGNVGFFSPDSFYFSLFRFFVKLSNFFFSTRNNLDKMPRPCTYLAVELKDFVVEINFSPKEDTLCCSSSFTFT